MPDAVHVRAHRDHPRALGGHEAVEEQAGEGEVAQVVGGHLQLEAVGRLPVRRPHHAGVVDEEVQPGVAGENRVGRPSDRHQIGQVEVESSRDELLEIALQFVARPARLLRGRGRP